MQLNYIECQKYWQDNGFSQFDIPFDIYMRVCWVVREKLKDLFIIKETAETSDLGDDTWMQSLVIEIDEMRKLKMIFNIIKENFVLLSTEDREDLIKQYYRATYKENETALDLEKYINFEFLYNDVFLDATYTVLPKFYVEDFSKKYFVVDNETGYYLFRI